MKERILNFLTIYYRATLALLHRKKWLRVSLIALASAFVLFLLLDAFFPVPASQVHYSQIITASDGTVLYAFLSDDDKWRMKTELQEISPLLRKTIINKEDKWFYWHYGVNPIAIVRALFKNVLHLRTTSGASTISMQVARLLEPKPRTLWNKLLEAFRAVQLEWHYSKDEILQLYLNLVPYGGNIEGVKAASMLFFDRQPLQLSLAQVTTLAVIPNRPTTLRIGESNPEIQRQRDVWLQRFAENKVFSREQTDEAQREPCILRRSDVPHIAPHFAWRMRSRFPNEPIIRTRLNVHTQGKVQTLAYNYIQRLKFLGIHNCSAIVINNATRDVEAYLGSPDFNDKTNAGQVDGVQAVRSPGSALKPLVYAMAIDRGLLTPKTVVTDVPVNFDGYTPENFDETYKGTISVEKALALSLNIPAVKTLSEVGVQNFTQKLSQLGFKSIRADAKNVGLSLILGGCGVRLEEMAHLYSGFAREGMIYPLHWVQDDTSTSSSRMISPSASFMITEILTQLTRPDLPVNYQSSMHAPKIAWKTGTSYGRRDAWSIGYNKHYTIAVWVGNFSGNSIPDLSGSSSATPLLFDIFNALDYNAQGDWYAPPKELDFRIVCAESGLPPSDVCQSTVTDYFIPTVSPSQPCSHLKEVYVSPDEKTSYCTSCLPSSGYKKKLFENYPPELLTYYQAERITVNLAPEHNPECTRIFADHAPGILSPVNGKSYIVNRTDKEPMLLSCAAANDVKNVYWFVNDRLYKVAPPGDKVFFKPKRGENKISCSDDKGRNSNIYIQVEWE